MDYEDFASPPTFPFPIFPTGFMTILLTTDLRESTLIVTFSPVQLQSPNSQNHCKYCFFFSWSNASENKSVPFSFRGSFPQTCLRPALIRALGQLPWRFPLSLWETPRLPAPLGSSFPALCPFLYPGLLTHFHQAHYPGTF